MRNDPPYTDPRLARAAALFSLEFRMRQRLYMENDIARMKYGEAGNVVSGGHCDGWPEEAKRASRRRNRAANRLQTAGFNARPPRVRHDTMKQLRLNVQTYIIRQQHGNA